MKKKTALVISRKKFIKDGAELLTLLALPMPFITACSNDYSFTVVSV